MTIFRPAVSSCLGWHEAALHLHGFRASAGLHINYRMRIKENMLCLRNSGCATIVKENEILGRGKKYFLHYGEKVLLIFNDGGTEIELHFKNIKPKER